MTGGYKDHEPTFRHYATCYWARHYGKVTNPTEKSRLNEALMEFVFGHKGSAFELWLDEVRELVNRILPNSVILAKELAAADSASKSPIFVASVYGILPIFEHLTATSEGVDWNIKNIHYVSALYLAARFGQLEAAKYLLQKGADVNSQGGLFGNPTQAAAFHGHTAVLGLLADHRSDLLAGGRFPNAFHAALIGNQNSAMKLLLEGHWMNEITDMDDVLSRAGYYGHREIVEILLRRKEERDKTAVPPISITSKEPVTDQSDPDFPHDTLQAALFSGRPGSRVAMRLLKRIGDVNDEGGHFGNALQAACAGGYLPSVRWLLEHGANLNSSGRYGSALRAACLGGHDDVVNHLLEAGARIGSSYHFDAFEAAASRNHLPALILLIKNLPPATKSKCEHTGRSKNPLEPALRSACLRGHVDIVRYLLANGAEDSAALGLEEALTSGQEEVIEILLGILEEVPDYIRHQIVRCSANDVLDLVPPMEFSRRSIESPDAKADHHERSFLETRIHTILKESLEIQPVDARFVPNIDADYPQGKKFIWRLAASRASRVTFERLISKGMPLDGNSNPSSIEIAALHGNLEVVELLLERKVTVGMAVQCAIRAGREDILRLILSKQPEITIDKTLGVPSLAEEFQDERIYPRWPEMRSVVESPIALAMAWKNESIIELLLEHGKSTEWPEPSFTLVLQASSGNKSNVRRLLTQLYGSSILLGELGLRTNALHAARAAAANGHVDVVDTILQLVNPPPDIRLGYLKEIAYEATLNDRFEVLNLIDETASPGEQEHISGIKLLAVSCERSWRSEARAKEILDLCSPSEVLQLYIEKAFREALEVGNLEVACFLLEHPCSQPCLIPFVKSTHDILHVVMNSRHRRIWWGHLHLDESLKCQEIVKTLIGMGADIEGLDEHMRPPVYYTCRYGLPETFQTFLDHGVSISKVYDTTTAIVNEIHGSPSEHEDSDNRSKEDRNSGGANLLKLTLDCININTKPQDICKSWGPIVLKLLEAGLRCESWDESMGNLLYAISASGNIELLEKLFQYGVDPNLPVRPGNCDEHFGSAIHVAAVKDQVEIVKSLLKHGASASAKQTCRRHLEGDIEVTPAQAALRWGHESSKWDRFWEVCELLVEAGAGEDDCRDVLKAACEQGNILLARRLIDRGARLSEMPITISLDIVKLMVEHGTTIDSPTGRAAELQHKAIRTASCDLLEYLIGETGLLLPAGQIMEEVFTKAILMKVENQKRVLEVMLQKGHLAINGLYRCACGKTWTNLFQQLIVNRNMELILWGLAQGADPQCPGCPDTAISLLFSHYTRWYKKGEIKLIAERLLDHGANINGVREAPEEQDNTPLQTPLLCAFTFPSIYYPCASYC
ncbi:ankyrin repeat-containing domain protein [Xylaria sp. FL1777]|nr:ankyrin repeat-containing domain protein [Xylaria sp. FL1777]